VSHGFYSQILNYKKWRQCPVWKNFSGEEIKISFCLSETSFNRPTCKRFIKYNWSLYPDLRYVGPIDRVVRSGIEKKKASPGYFHNN
jgi:hypothetical protein